MKRTNSISVLGLIVLVLGCISPGSAEARSSVPSLGYTGAYAFANVFLTVAGSIILLL